MTSTVAADAGSALLGRSRTPTTRPRPVVDAVAAEQAAADLLIALGMNLTDENLVETPRQMAHALIEMTSGPEFDLIEAEHTCMSLRGARAVGARTTTSALFRQLRDDPRSRAEFVALNKSTR